MLCVWFCRQESNFFCAAIMGAFHLKDRLSNFRQPSRLDKADNLSIKTLSKSLRLYFVQVKLMQTVLYKEKFCQIRRNEL